MTYTCDVCGKSCTYLTEYGNWIEDVTIGFIDKELLAAVLCKDHKPPAMSDREKERFNYGNWVEMQRALWKRGQQRENSE